MGLFSKQKITIEQLADTLADRVFESEVLSEFFKKTGSDIVVNDAQRKELLALNMLATTKSIQLAFNDTLAVDDVLEAFHRNVYGKISRFSYEQVQFEKFIGERYNGYYEALSSDSANKMVTVGRYFVGYLALHTEKKVDPLLGLIIAEIFSNYIQNTENFLKEVRSKFDVVKG